LRLFAGPARSGPLFSLPAFTHRFQDNATTRMTDHYTTLGLSSAATLADIKKAFRQQASFWHPDKNAAPDAAARFRAVQAAYDVLSDADKRQAYDDNRRRNLLDSPIDTARDIWNHYFNPLI
jgi:curved DNA-binding protein CbpA